MASSASCLFKNIIFLNIINYVDSLVEVSDKAKAPALLSAVVLGDVHVPDPPIFVKKALQVVRCGPVFIHHYLEVLE